MTARKPPKPDDPRFLFPDETKECGACGQIKKLGEFHMDRDQGDMLAIDCRECAAPAIREYHLIRKYGLTQADYERMFEAQGGKCAICRSEKSFGRGTHFNIDHDHGLCPPHKIPAIGCPKCVRGLVCNRCNILIGWLEDHGEEVRTYLPNLFWLEQSEQRKAS